MNEQYPEPLNVHIRLLGKKMIRKLGLEAHVSSEVLDAGTRITQIRIEKRYGIQPYDPKQGWQEILAAREWIRVLTGRTFASLVRPAKEKYANTKEIDALIDSLQKKLGVQPKKGIDFSVLLGIKKKSEEEGTMAGFDPLTWDFEIRATETLDWKVARLSCLEQLMSAGQEGGQKSFQESIEKAKLAEQARKEDRGQEP